MKGNSSMCKNIPIVYISKKMKFNVILCFYPVKYCVYTETL